MRNIIKGNEKYNEAFLKSLDNDNTWSEINSPMLKKISGQHHTYINKCMHAYSYT